MPIVSLAEIKEQLAITDDVGTLDDALLNRKIAAAQNQIERLLGFRIEARFGGEGQEPIPPALIEAVSQLVGWWYANRETAGEGAREMPFGVSEIVAEFRDWSF